MGGGDFEKRPSKTVSKKKKKKKKSRKGRQFIEEGKSTDTVGSATQTRGIPKQENGALGVPEVGERTKRRNYFTIDDRGGPEIRELAYANKKNDKESRRGQTLRADPILNWGKAMISQRRRPQG